MEIEKGYTAFTVDKIRNEVHKVIVEQHEIFYYTVTALLSAGHILYEGVPGLAKTLMARVVSKSIGVDFKRVSFTSDLMPSDILGTTVYQMNKGEFELRKGPLFTNIFLADEINRTPPKTQSALLEVMEERSITIDGQPYPLADPFLVIATQNPIEYEGAFPLPEALTDRFMMKVIVQYPGAAAEKQTMLKHHQGFSAADLNTAGVNAVCSAEDIRRCQEEIKNVRVDDGIFDYILNIVELTRHSSAVAVGASPRGSINLMAAAKTYAAIQDRDFVIPDDILELVKPILRHRIILKPEIEIDGVTTDAVIDNIVSKVTVPR